MGADKICSVSGCTNGREDDIVLHKFPNPGKDQRRFIAWVQAVGGNLLCLDDNYVYKYRKICHAHFEPKYWTRSKMLSSNAIPTLQMKGAATAPLAEVTNKNNTLETTETSFMHETATALTSSNKQGTATASTSNLTVTKSEKARPTKMIIIVKKNGSSIAIMGKDDEPGGPTTSLVDGVRLLKKRGNIAGRGRKVGDRKRNTCEGTSQRDGRSDAEEVVRDQPRVRDGETRREKGPDAEERERPRVREGVTQREKRPDVGPRDQLLVCEGVTQRGKRPDAEPRVQGQVREGATQREKPPHTTESAGSTSRPPHTSTDASRDDPRPRLHRGRRSGSLHTTTLPGTFMPQPGPSSTGQVKREHPDDTASPSTLQGDAKRVRVHSGQGELRTCARATKDIPAWLSVAICFPPPSRDLTEEEAEQVKVGLEDLLMGTDPTKPLPAFRGYPWVAEGNVQMWCENDYALTWLTRNVPLLKLPNTDLKLTVLQQSDVATRVRASLFVPRYRGDVERLQSILIRQNTWYDIARWSLYRATAVGGDNYGTNLTLGVPPEEVVKVLGRERRISYLLGSIYVRFSPTTQPSDRQTDPTTTPTMTRTDDTDTD